MSNVTIIDFEDSFTYNIAAEIYDLGISPRVVPLKKASVVLNEILQTSNRHAIILGPGPGGPWEYEYLNDSISRLLELENIFFMGICLGDQIIWGIKGVGTINSSNPVHGGRIETIIPALSVFPKKFWGKKVLVQRYNSLTLNTDELKTLFLEESKECQERLKPLEFKDLSTGECMGLYINRCITYQFHPESVGTSFRKLFFAPITDFLYNV